MNFKKRLQEKENVIGAFLGFYSPHIVEMIGYSGFEFIVIDDEHGAFSYSEIENLIRTADAVNLSTIVRVSYDTASIQKALDRGAAGIQVPMVNNKADAKKIVKAAKFPPYGTRGVAYSHRAGKYGTQGGEAFLNRSNDETLIIAHIETEEAIDNFEEIMSVEGIDIAFLGITDLSINMGHPEELQSKVIQEKVDLFYEKTKKMDVLTGTVASKKEAVRNAYEKGSNYVVSVVPKLIVESFQTFTNQLSK